MGGEAESGAVPGDCHARLFSAAAISPDFGEAGGVCCCGPEALVATRGTLGDTKSKRLLFERLTIGIIQWINDTVPN